jgi:imidazolonepropionase-like amidohydrolase
MRDLGIIENGSVLIVNGRIASVGRDIEAPAGIEDYDATGKVVLPGFVDSHTHLVWMHPRLLDCDMRIEGATYASIAAAGGGILSTVRTMRLTEEADLLSRARKTLAAFYQHGTTTIEAKSKVTISFRPISARTSFHPSSPAPVNTSTGSRRKCFRASNMMAWLCSPTPSANMEPSRSIRLGPISKQRAATDSASNSTPNNSPAAARHGSASPWMP